MSLVQKIMGRGSTEPRARERALKVKIAKPAGSRTFRVLNRDKMAQLHGSAPDLNFAMTASSSGRAGCSRDYAELGAALAAARAEYARTLENVVVLSDAGDVVLELGLE